MREFLALSIVVFMAAFIFDADGLGHGFGKTYNTFQHAFIAELTEAQ